MGQITYDHPDWARSIYWKFNPAEGWGGFHQELDEIARYANNAKEPFFIIFEPTGDVPKGNPIPPMRRIIQFSKQNSMVIQTIIIMESNWLIAKTFAKLLNKMMSLEPEVQLAFGSDKARSVYEASFAALQNK